MINLFRLTNIEQPGVFLYRITGEEILDPREISVETDLQRPIASTPPSHVDVAVTVKTTDVTVSIEEENKHHKKNQYEYAIDSSPGNAKTNYEYREAEDVEEGENDIEESDDYDQNTDSTPDEVTTTEMLTTTAPPPPIPPQPPVDVTEEIVEGEEDTGEEENEAEQPTAPTVGKKSFCFNKFEDQT